MHPARISLTKFASQPFHLFYQSIRQGQHTFMFYTQPKLQIFIALANYIILYATKTNKIRITMNKYNLVLQMD